MDARGFLEKEWETNIPEYVTNDDIITSGLLEAEIAPKKSHRDKALEYFQQAIEKDPEWAEPYAGLANAWSIFGTLLRVLPKSVTLPKVYEYLDKAFELDPNSAKAHYVKALNEVWTEFDWEQGEEYFSRSLESNPNDALCRIYYAHLCARYPG